MKRLTLAVLAATFTLAPLAAHACPPDAATAECGTHFDEPEPGPESGFDPTVVVPEQPEYTGHPIVVKDAHGFDMSTDVESLGAEQPTYEVAEPAAEPTVVEFDAGSDPLTGETLIGRTGGTGSPRQTL